MTTASSTYTGPEYWLVNATSEFSFDLVDMRGNRVATYPNVELAKKVCRDMEKKAMRQYLNAQAKAQRKS